MDTYDAVKPVVKTAYHNLHYCYEALYDLVQLELLTQSEATHIQRHIREVMVQVDDFILENELG